MRLTKRGKIGLRVVVALVLAFIYIPLLVIVILTATFVVVLAALIDILYALLDPRIRLA